MVTKIVVKRLGVALSSVSSTDKIGSTWGQWKRSKWGQKNLDGIETVASRHALFDYSRGPL